MSEEIKAFSVDIHITPCTNRCQHCWTGGSVENGRVPVDQVLFVLDKLAGVRQQIPQGAFFLYDEPTTHPHFIEIMERAAALGLTGDRFFLPTNGSVLARAPDILWRRLKDTGANCLQLTAYGLEGTHDAFAGRRGAFQDVVTTIRRAMEHGLEWYAGVVLHAGNVDELQQTVSYLRSLDPSGTAVVGWYPFSWQGRGRNAGRVRASDYMRLPRRMRRQRASLVPEREAVITILDNPGLVGRPVGDQVCESTVFQVDRDLRVFCGGACDSAGILGAAPDLAPAFLLGELDEGGFLPLLQHYRRAPPRSIELLKQITWGELARRYGDRTNDEIYWLNDLPTHKWAAAYLRDTL